jgi:SAM-dependent methyltransferase
MRDCELTETEMSDLGPVHRSAVRVLRKLPGGKWLLDWTDPLHVANRCLRQSLQKSASFAKGWLLDLGCGGLPYRDIYHHVERYIGLDLPPNDLADVHGDGMMLPVADQVFHTVLCNQVLEHVPEPSMLLAEITRVLRPGGVLLLTTPQTWGLHRQPNDFYRYTEYGLRYLAEKSGLDVVEVIPTCGLSATLAQRIVDTVVYPEPNRRPPWLELSLSLLMAPVLMTGYGFDKLFGKRGDPLDHVLIARRPDDS